MVCYGSGVVTCILAYDLIECRFFFFFFFYQTVFLEAERARTAFESGTIGVRMRTSLRHNLHKIQEFTLF